MNLENILKKYSWKALESQAKQMKLKNSEILKLKDAWKELSTLNAVKNDEKIEISMDIDGFYALKEERMHVFGRTDEEEEIDLSFYDWKQWLGFEVNDLLKYVMSEVEVIIHCIREMTTWGLDRGRVLSAVGAEVEYGKDNYISTNSNKKDNVVYLFNR